MTYDEAAKAWAAETYGLDADLIVSVDFGTSVDGYESSGYTSTVDVHIDVTEVPAPMPPNFFTRHSYVRSDGAQTIWTELHCELGDMVRQLVEIALRGES